MSVSNSNPARAFLIGAISVLPLLVWWAGWYPGFLSSDSVDQVGQAFRFDFANFHPIAHTASIWLLTIAWETPAAVTLVQLLVMAGILALAARRLSQLGVPFWLAGGAAIVIASIPMVAATTITVWKDVPFTLALLWAFTELLLIGRDRTAFWSSPWGPLRLGTALGLVWAFRSNGFLTVVPVLIVLAVVERHRLLAWARAVGAVAVVGLLLPLGLQLVLPVEPGGIEPAQVFLSDLAATAVHAPDTIDSEDAALLTAVAPLAVWTERYDCTDSTPLAFAEEFRAEVMADRPGPYRSLILEQVLQATPTIAGHRWCAADYLFVPVARTGTFLHYPPFAIPANDLGISRDPLSFRAYDATLVLYQFAETPERQWFTWRPALAILVGIAVWVAVATRRPLRMLLLAGSLYFAQLANVALTTPAQEFRFAFGLYVIALLSVPLLWLVVRPPAQAAANRSAHREPSDARQGHDV